MGDAGFRYEGARGDDLEASGRVGKGRRWAVAGQIYLTGNLEVPATFHAFHLYLDAVLLIVTVNCNLNGTLRFTVTCPISRHQPISMQLSLSLALFFQLLPSPFLQRTERPSTESSCIWCFSCISCDYCNPTFTFDPPLATRSHGRRKEEDETVETISFRPEGRSNDF